MKLDHIGRTGLITLIVLVAAFCIALGMLVATGTQTTMDVVISGGIFLGFISVVFLVKTKLRSRSVYRVLLGSLLIAMLLVSCAYVQDSFSSAYLVEMMISLLVVILLVFRMRRSDLSEPQDERSIRIGTYGLSCSWYLTFVVVALLAWLTSVMKITLDAGIILILLLLLMWLSAVFSQYYFNLRGDI